ncbi:hypothetical protein Sango_0229100 [Sesamum angolense]|uniref:Uncharacterized protein n=1 Tax=Sesamum angolense TaxID=2727404 RepID=A0AAE2C768_9LAMI|nr:hypothetical protein Sango_0229100 [Sesamum angolense]
MEGSLRYNRRRSGYEPSDTETDWHDSPRREDSGYDENRSKSPLTSVSRLQSDMLKTGPAPWRHSNSPHRPRGENGNVPPLHNSEFHRNVSPLSRRTYSDIRTSVSPFLMSERRTSSDNNNSGNACPFSQSERRTNSANNRENMSPFTISERRRHVSPYKTSGEGNRLVYGQANHDLSRGADRSTYRRAASAPRARLRERGHHFSNDQGERKKQDRTQEERDASHKHGLQDYNATFQNVVFPSNGTTDPRGFLPKPPGFVDKSSGLHQGNKLNASFSHNSRPMSQTTTNSSSVISRRSSNATNEIFPHVLLKGPPGTGIQAHTSSCPVSSSPHHVELNVYLEPKAAYALTSLVKQISSEHAVTPEMSAAPRTTDYKVLVLYDVDKAAENIQHLTKWIMDCYSDSCKLILCCEDDVDILESVKSRCKVIKVEAPVTHEIMEVLIQIAKKEDFELSMSFAAKIAIKSKQNLRRAIMALEACKAHNNKEPILQKLVEQFLRGVEASLKRELYYWYAYYDKRLPTGTSALLKLEEFVAKFMSIYRKSSSNRQLS